MILNKLLKWVSNCIRLAPLQIITILLMSAICSCGSSKKAQKQVEVVKIETNTKSADSTSLVKENLITATDSSTEDLEVTITEYDTTLPVDSATNKPPIKKEVKVRKKRNNHKTSEQKQEEKQETKSEVAEVVHVQDSMNVEAVKEKTETTIPKQIGGVVWAACTLIGLIIVLYIVRRFRNR